MCSSSIFLICRKLGFCLEARTKGEAVAANTVCLPFEHDTLLIVSKTFAEGTVQAHSVLFPLSTDGLYLDRIFVDNHVLQSTF